jgi:hypothetical protein
MRCIVHVHACAVCTCMPALYAPACKLAQLLVPEHVLTSIMSLALPCYLLPQVRVALSVSAPLFKTALSPGDLGQLDFIQGMLGAAIKDMLVEPRRIAVSLDTEIRVEEVRIHSHGHDNGRALYRRDIFCSSSSAGCTSSRPLSVPELVLSCSLGCYSSKQSQSESCCVSFVHGSRHGSAVCASKALCVYANVWAAGKSFFPAVSPVSSCCY